MPVSESAACQLRLRVSARTSSGGHKFVLHALRVLVQPVAQTTAPEAPGRALAHTDGAEPEAQPWMCDSSLPQQTHSYLNDAR